MVEVFTWIENTGFATWVRESPSPFAYTGMLVLHAVGLAFVVGMNTAIDLRILGVAPQIPLPAIGRLFPALWFGFWVNAISGVGLLTSNAVSDLTSPIFYTKITFVILAVTTAVKIRRRVFPANAGAVVAADAGKRLATLSLICWTIAITAGRLVEYPELLGLTK